MIIIYRFIDSLSIYNYLRWKHWVSYCNYIKRAGNAFLAYEDYENLMILNIDLRFYTIALQKQYRSVECDRSTIIYDLSDEFSFEQNRTYYTQVVKKYIRHFF